MNTKRNLLVIAAAVIALSCVGGPVEIPADITAAELVQRGQEASDKNWYTQAIQYYSTILERFPAANEPANYEYVCAAEYEIAFIHYKEQKYDQAKEGFTALLARYSMPDSELLPPQYRVLAEDRLEDIAEIEAARNPPAPNGGEGLSPTP